MSEFIENPFNELWNNFDLDQLKVCICEIIDKLGTADEESLTNLLEELDDLVMSYVIVLKLKDSESIEVIKVSEMPKEIMDKLGFDESDALDGFVPKELIPEEFLKALEAATRKKPKKNNWIIDKE